MKADLYTKIMLTVIAGNLTFFMVKELNIIPRAYAQGPETTPETNMELKAVPEYGLIPLNADGTINVKVTNTEAIKVDIHKISTNSDLNVNISSTDYGAFKYAGTLDVDVR